MMGRKLRVVNSMTARTSKETLGFVTSNARSVVEEIAEISARAVATTEQLVSPTRSAAVETQIAAGEDFMARYKQTFTAEDLSLAEDIMRSRRNVLSALAK